jgi:hypothetical protein
MKLIESKTLATAAASIEFTSIPQDATDLVVLGSVRSTRTGQLLDNFNITFNGSSSGYSERLLYGANGSTGSLSNSGTKFIFLAYATTADSTSNTFSNFQIYIPNYAGSTNKSVSSESVTENNATNGGTMGITAGLWSNTSAISSITIGSDFNLVAGTVISLYKVTKGSDGIVTTSP